MLSHELLGAVSEGVVIAREGKQWTAKELQL
jgi:hypothetical protein